LNNKLAVLGERHCKCVGAAGALGANMIVPFAIVLMLVSSSVALAQGAPCEAHRQNCIASGTPANICNAWAAKAEKTGVWDAYTIGTTTYPAQNCTRSAGGAAPATGPTCSGMYQDCTRATRNPQTCVKAKADCMKTGRWIGPETGRDLGAAAKQ
jgi:hypothetical protein